jgi:hypothetical protein
VRYAYLPCAIGTALPQTSGEFDNDRELASYLRMEERELGAGTDICDALRTKLASVSR